MVRSVCISYPILSQFCEVRRAHHTVRSCLPALPLGETRGHRLAGGRHAGAKPRELTHLGAVHLDGLGQEPLLDIVPPPVRAPLEHPVVQNARTWFSKLTSPEDLRQKSISEKFAQGMQGVRSVLHASMPARRSGCTADRPCSDISVASLACGRASAHRDARERRTCACDRDSDGGSHSTRDNSSHGSGEVAEGVRRRQRSMQVSLSWAAAVALAAIIAFALPGTADCGHSGRGAPRMQRHATPQPRGATSPQMSPLTLRLRGGGGDNQARTMPQPTHLREQNLHHQGWA